MDNQAKSSYETLYGKKVEGVLHYRCDEHPEKLIDLIKFVDGTQKNTCDLFRTKDCDRNGDRRCDHSCVYGNIYRGVMY